MPPSGSIWRPIACSSALKKNSGAKRSACTRSPSTAKNNNARCDPPTPPRRFSAKSARPSAALYGFQDAVASILNGLYEASLHVDLNRLPELFCGFHKRTESTGPTLYPVACAPQAWAAAAPYLLLQSMLGLQIKAAERQVCFTNPILPANIEEVRIDNLGIPDADCDVIIHRYSAGVS